MYFLGLSPCTILYATVAIPSESVVAVLGVDFLTPFTSELAPLSTNNVNYTSLNSNLDKKVSSGELYTKQIHSTDVTTTVKTNLLTNLKYNAFGALIMLNIKTYYNANSQILAYVYGVNVTDTSHETYNINYIVNIEDDLITTNFYQSDDGYLTIDITVDNAKGTSITIKTIPCY